MHWIKYLDFLLTAEQQEPQIKMSTNQNEQQSSIVILTVMKWSTQQNMNEQQGHKSMKTTNPIT